MQMLSQGFPKIRLFPRLAQASSAPDDGLPKRVVYNNQNYLLTSSARGMITMVAVEGNPTPIGMVMKSQNGPVQYKALDNRLETAALVKAVYTAYAGDAALATTTGNAAKLAAPPKFISRDDFEVQVNNPATGKTDIIHGHFMDGRNPLNQIKHGIQSFGLDKKAEQLVELSLNGGPKGTYTMEAEVRVYLEDDRPSRKILAVLASVAPQVDAAAKDYQMQTAQTLHYAEFLDNLAARYAH